ncbi:ATP-binding protein [Fluviibacter phosphoraccumulans]|uniref:histidine kinase n=1 Tax=Fluviibacter phosphoraccumulans TaxID=1751046 RepID=A0A7R6R7Q8_9RHOO|nr:ATP-binding protein [Fluviibacter phosphoraccumulans]BBU69770.1 hypothetical protein ICHIAU1_20530 [Fluviibacter phosphoraccumulans]BBU71047.1 hypothetical protein ICHIJ1_09660 [Fluviibacter phosphoraccumulans]
MKNWSRSLILALLMLVATSCAIAQDFVTERAWVEDPSGTKTLAEIKKLPETPLAGKLFTQGYSNSAFWMRLHIDPGQAAHNATDKLIVRLRPPYQDQIWLFDPLAPQDQVRVTGDHYDWADDEYRSLNLNFVIPVGTQPRDIWLRLKTTVSTMTFIEVMTDDQVRAADRHQEMVTMLYLSVLFICFGWAVLARINRKDALLSCYIVREAFVIAYALAILGYFRVLTSGWLPPSWLDTTINLLGFAFPAIVVWFDARLISEFKPRPWLARLHFSMIFFFPVEVVLVFTGNTAAAARLSSLVVLAILLLVVACAMSTQAWAQARNAPPEQQPVYSKSLLVFIYALVAVVILLHRLPLMGTVAGQEYFVYFNLVFPLLTSITLMVLVQVRAHRLAQRQLEAQFRLERAEVETALERERRIEQSRFVSMLAHELKTPISVARLSLDAMNTKGVEHDRIQRALQNMNDVVERCRISDALEGHRFQVMKESFGLREAVFERIDLLPNHERVKVFEGNDVYVYTDWQLVSVIIANLLDNALKYSPDSSEVEVYVSQQSREGQPGASLVVTNQIGPTGIPDADKVFQKYYRAKTAEGKSGSGLGLYLTAGIAELLGGVVSCRTVESCVEFELWIPD